MTSILEGAVLRGTGKKLKETKPNIEFSSDFIIGYPEEKEEDFNQTLSLMKNVKFINMNKIHSAKIIKGNNLRKIHIS